MKTLIQNNRISVFILSILFSVHLVKAQSTDYTYCPLFEDGKIWVIVEKYYDSWIPDTITFQKTVTIDKATSEDNDNVWKVHDFSFNKKQSIDYNMYEDDKSIYLYRDGFKQYYQHLDFNKNLDETINVIYYDETLAASYNVVKDEIINIKGYNRRILSISSEKYGCPEYYWIEGIGAINDLIMSKFRYAVISAPLLVDRTIKECYLNGKLIFSYEDLENYIRQSGVEKTDNKTANIVEDNGYLSYGRDALEVTGFSGDVTVEIYSMDGTLCISEMVGNGQTVSTSTLPYGCFIAHAKSSLGSSATFKFIK